MLDAKTREVFKVGDLIYFTDINMSDEWVTRVLPEANNDGYFYEFAPLETEHPDLSGYITSTDAELLFAKKTDLQAAQNTITTRINTLEGEVNKKASQDSLNTLQGEVDKLEEDLSKIDVSSQITSKINELDVTKVGGASGSYISAIEQVDGKIVATASTLPDYDKNAQDKADKSLEDAKSYVEDRLGDVGESTIKDYVDNIKSTIEQDVSDKDSAMDGRVKVLEQAKTSIEGRLGTNETNIQTNATNISNVSTRVQTLEGVVNGISTKVSNIETKLQGIEEGAQTNRIEVVKVGGKALEITNKEVNIDSISTDLLTQGEKTLVLDCLNASLTKSE